MTMTAMAMIVSGHFFAWFIIWSIIWCAGCYCAHIKIFKLPYIFFHCIVIILLAIGSELVDIKYSTPITNYTELSLQKPITELQIFHRHCMLATGKKDNVSVYYYLEDNGQKEINYIPTNTVTIMHDDIQPGIYAKQHKQVVQGVFKYELIISNTIIIVIPHSAEIIEVPNIREQSTL